MTNQKQAKNVFCWRTPPDVVVGIRLPVLCFFLDRLIFDGLASQLVTLLPIFSLFLVLWLAFRRAPAIAVWNGSGVTL
jgi:hypothetical protein